MERDFAGVRMTPEAHQQLVSACLPDGRFPGSYEAWVELVDNGTQQAIQDGRSVSELVVDVQDFLSWCRRITVHPSFDSLRAYLILRRGGSAVLPGHGVVRPKSQPDGDGAPPAAASPPPPTAKRVRARRALMPPFSLSPLASALCRWTLGSVTCRPELRVIA
jgi:hypothetical protein